ncbi:MAG TPA: prepilin-type N-terminal cleavage/methylation domain-containing protein [Luteibacter sp.]|uniref:type IV pilus modification PilV family protein n=1 Tax=Luteibacter sp. TaxID=1886636 RepID=UPI002CEB702B|nr:prepilin-type N-terminal cleavage/methylation domain-containing protein [Luteibacter sp.]HVI54875.1 prepilin-type N-terminal cleavage/methylation domain-containing protein [Luteibacter sp.]
MNRRGSSLVESLVAMSVFSIGSAATGAWIAHVLMTDARASRLLAADAIAASLDARMRSNGAGVAAGSYMAAPQATSCVQACDAAALAADDIRRFRQALAANLGPAADGVVACETTGACAIRITWQHKALLAWPPTP